MDFNPLDYPLAFTVPEHLSEVSAWIGHIPFAFALLEMTQPRVIVELGTHKGDSYCAFCQGVMLRKLATRCVAIDSWQGDAHSIEYGPEVLQNLRAYHDPRYGSFSKLMQSDFATAAGTFDDRSIDLLHIDGLHTYEAVQQDYETWRGKMSDRGVILFHDTAEREGDFGVWKLWEELSGQFPSFAFEHSFGLGVLVVGENAPAEVRAFIATAKQRPERVRAYFAALGNGIAAIRMTRYCLGAMHWQRQQIDQWRQKKGLPPSQGPSPLSARMSAIDQLMGEFDEVLRSGG
jgi:hypothetical protein